MPKTKCAKILFPFCNPFHDEVSNRNAFSYFVFIVIVFTVTFCKMISLKRQELAVRVCFHYCHIPKTDFKATYLVPSLDNVYTALYRYHTVASAMKKSHHVVPSINIQ